MCLGYKYKLLLTILINIEMYLSCSYCQAELFEGNNFLEEEKCYQGLGCVRLTREWMDPRFRPINVLPTNRHAVNTIFVHWTLLDDELSVSHPSSGTRGIIFHRDNAPAQTAARTIDFLNKSGVQLLPHPPGSKLTPNVLGTGQLTDSKRLKILVHDFTSNGYTGWIRHLSRALLANSEIKGTVVSVDWAAGAEPPYVQAVANARLVALEILNFLNNLQMKFDLKPETVHIIGHGVGAHIAGYVGKMRHLRRITAFDPSGPYFKSMPPNVRLHINDAQFIEVIHSDASTYGQGNDEKLGHIDFFPNGGKEQPGCEEINIKVTSVQRGDLKLGETLPACSHKRSITYYIEALVNSSCVFLGIACKSYKEFLKGKCVSCGKCDEHCARLHPLSHPREINNRRFFFVTANASPFCGEMLKVLLVLKSKLFDQRFVKGYFNVTVPQHSGNVSFLLNENHLFTALRSDDHHVFVVFRSTPPVLNLPARAVYIKWIHAPLPCFLCTPPKIRGFTIYKMGDKKNVSPQWFCPVSGPAVGRVSMSFKPCHKVESETRRSPVKIDYNDYYYENIV